MHGEIGPDKGRFEIGKDSFIEQGNLNEEVILKRLLVNPKLVCDQANSRYAASFAIAPVVHLY
jgi:hypothetical protein